MNNFQIVILALHLESESSPPTITAREIAEALNMDTTQLNNTFKKWGGTNFENFIALLSVKNIKKSLSLAEPLSSFQPSPNNSIKDEESEGRFRIIKMSSKEYNDTHLELGYNYYNTPFGQVIAASSAKGICYIAFDNDRDKGLKNLKAKYPTAQLTLQANETLENAIQVFHQAGIVQYPIDLHVKGTDFQLQVWQHLTQIPFGQLSTYQGLAQSISAPKASRAVGTAVGKNPVAYLIPCHRIVRSTGVLGNYMWGALKKKAIIGWELSQSSNI